MYYGTEIILDSGVELEGYEREQTAIILEIPLAGTLFIGTLIQLFFIDNLGRRSIILWTLPFVFLSLLLIALSMYLNLFIEDEDTRNASHVVFFVGIFSYLLAFALGFSGTIWTINAEIYPIHLAGTAAALATATNWLSNFVVSSVFLSSMETKEGKVYTFVVLACFALAAWIFVFFLLPETAGKRIDENVKAIVGEVVTYETDEDKKD